MLNRLHCFQVLESKEKQDQSTAVRPEDVVQEFKLRTPFRKSDQYAHTVRTQLMIHLVMKSACS